jgi:hypothetical protein
VNAALGWELDVWQTIQMKAMRLVEPDVNPGQNIVCEEELNQEKSWLNK